MFEETDCHLAILWGSFDLFFSVPSVRIPVRIAHWTLRVRIGRFIVFPSVSNLLLPLIAFPEIYRDIANSYTTSDSSYCFGDGGGGGRSRVDWQFCAMLGKVLRSGSNVLSMQNETCSTWNIYTRWYHTTKTGI